MKLIKITPEPNVLYQQQVLNLTVNKKTTRVIFELRYLFRTDKWYVSLFDAQTGAPLCTYIPLVSSTIQLNNLLEPFSYKNLGWLACIPIVDEPSTENPSKNNLSEFAIVWGDSFE